jgi:hypothetical protein
LVVTGLGLVHSPGVAAFDRHATSLVVARRSPALDTAMKVVAQLGSWVALVIAGTLLAGLAVLRRNPARAPGPGLAAWAGESAAVTVTKHVVERPRLVPVSAWMLLVSALVFPGWRTAGRTVRTEAPLSALGTGGVEFPRIG